MDFASISRRIFLLISAIFATVGVLEARRGGGSRSGGSRSGSSYRGGSSRSSGVRYSSTSYVRSGSRVSSSYVSYVPSVRYTRAYSSSRIGSGYWYYYSLYFAYARSPSYLRRRRHRYDDDVSVCVNYESDSSGNGTSGNDTTLGIFVCPLLDEEPRSYTQCCGDQYAEYCCERRDEGMSVGMIVAVAIGSTVLIIAVIFFYQRQSKMQIARRSRIVHRDQIRGMAVAHVQSQNNTTRQRVPSKTYEEDANTATASPSYWAYSNPTNPTEQPHYPSTEPQYPPIGQQNPQPTPQYSVNPQEAPPYPTGGDSMPVLYPPTQITHPVYPPQPAHAAPYPAEPPP